MKIGIDLQVLPSSASEITGVSNYAYLLTKYLLKLRSSNEFVLFVKNQSDLTRELEGLGGEIVNLPSRGLPFVLPHMKYAWIMEKAGLDLLHGPAFTTPLFFRGKTVITIHDLAIYKHPEWFPGGQWFSTRVLVPRSIKKTDKIITISESTKKDIVELFGVEEPGISVVPLGVEEQFFRAAADSSRTNVDIRGSDQHPVSVKSASSLRNKRYLLFVGTLEPRKNLVRLIKAYSQLPRDLTDKYDLVIAGGRGWKYTEIENAKTKALDNNSKLKNKIKFIGTVNGEQLINLYHGASLFVFPTLYEGFGLPVLEAMASGVPVLSSNISSIPEFAENASILVNPYKVEEIREGIVKILKNSDLTQKLRELGETVAKKYTWEKTALRTLEVYEELTTDL